MLCYCAGKIINALTIFCNWLASFFALGIRWFLFQDFALKSGFAKLTDMESTIYLFQNEYTVSFLPLPGWIIEKFNLSIPAMPPVYAAYSGTLVEVIIPCLLLLGVFGRIPALILFIFNYVVVMSYPVLWQSGWEAALKDHYIWGMMIATLLFYGSGKFSIDSFLKSKFCENYKH